MTTVTLDRFSTQQAAGPSSKPSLWTRIINAMIASRQHAAQREVARVLAFYNPHRSGNG
jgi:hypothetical protein